MKTAFNKFLVAKDYRSAAQACKLLHDYAYTEKLRKALREAITADPKKEWLNLYRDTYDWWAFDRFYDFMLAVEWDRPAEEQFWLPRREKLMPIAQK